MVEVVLGFAISQQKKLMRFQVFLTQKRSSKQLMGRMLFWNDGFRFDGWFEGKTTIMQAFSCTIPRFFDLLHRRRRDRWICGHCFKAVLKLRLRVDSIDQSLMNLLVSASHSSNEGILLRSICSLKSDSICEPIKIVSRYWDRFNSPIKKLIFCFTNCDCRYYYYIFNILYV